MRVLMISDFYHPFLGGVEQHVRSLSTALVDRGYEVAVATLRQGDLPEFSVDHGVRIYRLRGSAQRAERLFASSGRPWAPPLPDPELTLGLRRVIEEERPEIVHGHDWMSRSFLPLKGWSGARFIVSLHYYTLSCAKKNLLYNNAPCSGPAPLKCIGCSIDHYGAAKGVATVSGAALGAALDHQAVDMFVSVSTATATGNGLDLDDPRSIIIPNFLPPKRGVSVDDISDYVAQLPEGEFLMYVGDLRGAKGLNVLLDAYARFSDAPPLVLIGKVWPETPATFPDNVIVLKDWPNEAVMEAWRRARIAVVPSVWPEPFGIVVIEAMTSGCPVVASRIGGIPDIVVDEETGLLVPPADPAALHHAIDHLINQPELMDRMGRAGRERARLFESDSVVPQIEQLYDSVVRMTPRTIVPFMARNRQGVSTSAHVVGSDRST